MLLKQLINSPDDLASGLLGFVFSCERFRRKPCWNVELGTDFRFVVVQQAGGGGLLGPAAVGFICRQSNKTEKGNMSACITSTNAFT